MFHENYFLEHQKVCTKPFRTSYNKKQRSKKLKTYETVIILDDHKIQDEGKAFVEEFSSKISGAGGEVKKVTSLGRKQFARQIKKRKTGLYWDFVINLDEKEAVKIPVVYSLDERVLRLQVFIYDRPEAPAPKAEPKTEVKAEPKAEAKVEAKPAPKAKAATKVEAKPESKKEDAAKPESSEDKK